MSATAAARLGYLALYGAVGASFPYFSVFYGSRGLGVETIGLLTSLGAVAGLVAAPLWGSAADRFSGSRALLPAAAIVAALGASALTIVREPLLVACAVAIMSLAFSGLGPTLDARALETVRHDQNRYGGLRAWGSASFIVVVWLTGAIIERLGAVSMFGVYVAMLLAFAVAAVGLRGQATGIRLPRLAGIGLVLRHAVLGRFLVAILLVWCASMGINWYLSVHLLEIGAPGELVGASWAIGALVEIPIMAAFPWLASRVGTERLLIVGAGAFVLRALAITVVIDPVLVALTMVLHGVGFGLMLVGGVTYVARHAPPAAAATAQGILSAAVFSLALIIGPGAGALVAGAWGPSAMFVTSAVVGSLAIGLLWFAVARPAAVRRTMAHGNS